MNDHLQGRVCNFPQFERRFVLLSVLLNMFLAGGPINIEYCASEMHSRASETETRSIIQK